MHDVRLPVLRVGDQHEVAAPGDSAEPPASPPGVDGAPEAASLLAVEAAVGTAETALSKSHFDEDQLIAMPEDEIDLIAAHARATRDEAHAAAAQKAEGPGFGAEAASMSEGGSPETEVVDQIA